MGTTRTAISRTSWSGCRRSRRAASKNSCRIASTGVVSLPHASQHAEILSDLVWGFPEGSLCTLPHSIVPPNIAARRHHQHLRRIPYSRSWHARFAFDTRSNTPTNLHLVQRHSSPHQTPHCPAPLNRTVGRHLRRYGICRTLTFVGPCFKIHARLQLGADTIEIWIWPLGTHRYLGYVGYVDLGSNKEPCGLPSGLLSPLLAGRTIFANIIVRAISKKKRARAHAVCMHRGRNAPSCG